MVYEYRVVNVYEIEESIETSYGSETSTINLTIYSIISRYKIYSRYKQPIVTGVLMSVLHKGSLKTTYEMPTKIIQPKQFIGVETKLYKVDTVVDTGTETQQTTTPAPTPSPTPYQPSKVYTPV
jgi:hypothetical protein